MSHDHDHQVHGGCESHGDEEHGGMLHRHDAVAGPGDELVTCAVRGNKTVKSVAEDTGLVRVHAGVRYYFCCGHCVEMFDADPFAYATVA